MSKSAGASFRFRMKGAIAIVSPSLAGLLVVLLVMLFLSGALRLFSTHVTADARASKKMQPCLARMNERVSVRAAGRGNPWISLSDGHDLLTAYAGQQEAIDTLDRNQARPLSLTSGDYDEDGVPDLICGNGSRGAGIITVHRGNVDSIYPNTLEAAQRRAEGTFTDAPFVSPAGVFSIPDAADFICAGDFDGDSHLDVVTAARGSTDLFLLSGDGRGGLGEARAISMPGRVTAMIAGEINRSDGLADVMVAVTTPQGSRVLVFEGPEGALRSKPETFAMPAEVSSLALGQPGNNFETDLAVAAGRDLVVIHGRDRKLSLDEIRRRAVPAARVSIRTLPFEIRSIATGDFTGSHSTELALLSDDGAVHLLTEGESGTQKGMASISEWNSKPLARGQWSPSSQLVRARVSSVPIDNLVVVDPESQALTILADDAEEWRRRESASMAASNYRGITATIDLEGSPVAVLPMRLNGDALTDLVIVRAGRSAPAVAMTQPQAVLTVTNINDSGFGSLRDQINQANASPGLDEIRFNIFGSGVHTITLLSALPTITDAVTIDGSTQPGFAGAPLIELDGSNFPAQRNTGVDGLRITAGGSTVRAMVINRFGDDAIELGTNGGNVVTGNFLGTDGTGTLARSNITGLRINGSANNTIGGTTAAARNLISGNGRVEGGSRFGLGILITATGAAGNSVQGNFIGVNSAGSAALANAGDGISMFQAGSNTIGGTTPGARNVISGNVGSGIFLSSGSLVQGNLIGLNATGNAAVGNDVDGVTAGGGSTIGGTTSAARNVISGSRSDGVQVSGTSNQIQGNFIGTDITGSIDLGNSFSGVYVQSANNTVGGAVASARNVISGNDTAGVAIEFSSGNQIQNNFIGTNAAGAAALGNSRDGVLILNGSRNTIGGSSVGNSIAFNGGNGVFIRNGLSASTRNSILSNSIFSNAGLGIRLEPGANNDQSSPALTGVSIAGGTATIQGVLNSLPNTTFTLEFFLNSACDPTGFGEGQLFIRSMPVATDTNGSASFSFSAQVSSGQRVTATATAPNGDTSEFSRCADPSSQGADLLIEASASTTTALRKSLITYSIRVTNGGPATATGVTLNNPTPAGTQFIFAETSQGTIAQPPFSGTGPITFSLGSMRPGSTATIKITVLVIAAVGTNIVDTATVSSVSNDPNQSTNSASLTTLVVEEFLTSAMADLSVTSTGSSGSVAAGTRLTYTIRVSNAGPDPAFEFFIIDRIPDGTTFAPIGDLFCTPPPAGSTGLIQCGVSDFSNPISAGGSKNFTLVVNVLAASGSTLTNHAEIFAPFQTLDPGEGGPNGVGIPLQRTFPADDPNPANNTVDSNTPVQGGSQVLLSWNQPTLNPGGADAARSAIPGSLRVSPSSATTTTQSLRRIVLPEDTGSCFLTRVNIYKADLPNVQAVANNLWKSVPPNQVQSTMAAAPAGSFYLLTNVWKCDDMEVESGVSNECSSSGTCTGGPTITGACKGDGKQLVINGSGFVEGAKVFLNGAQEKTSFVSATQVIAKKAGKRAATGDTLMVRNPDGTQSAQASYTKANCSP